MTQQHSLQWDRLCSVHKGNQNTTKQKGKTSQKYSECAYASNSWVFEPLWLNFNVQVNDERPDLFQEINKSIELMHSMPELVFLMQFPEEVAQRHIVHISISNSSIQSAPSPTLISLSPTCSTISSPFHRVNTPHRAKVTTSIHVQTHSDS